MESNYDETESKRLGLSQIRKTFFQQNIVVLCYDSKRTTQKADRQGNFHRLQADTPVSINDMYLSATTR